MANKLMDPIGKLMGLRYKSHPWHGVEISHVYGREEAMDLIAHSIEDYQTRFENLDHLLSNV